MINTTLLNIIGKFSTKEMREFGEFITSPFFNKNENVIKLYAYIKKFHPDFNDKKLEKEYVYKKLYSKGEYNDGFMRTVMYNLGKLAEDFLAYVNFTKDELVRGISLLDELSERKLEKVFLKYYNEIESELEKQKYHDAKFYYRKYQLKEQMEIYMDWSKFKNKDFKNYTPNTISYINDELTSFFITKALNHYRFLLDKSNYEPMSYEYGLMDNLIDYLRTNDNHYINKTKIRLHLYEVLIQKEGKEEYFQILKDLLISGEKALNHSDRYSLHNILQAYCIRKVYDGEDYRKERFELYKACVEQGLYKASEHIYFDDLMFANIAFSAMHMNEFSWAEKFIQDHKKALSPENSEVVINYCYARLCYEKNNTEEAMKYLSSIRTIKHVQFKLPIRDLTLILNYELGQYSQAYYQIDSYRHFLSNNKNLFADARLDRLNNFVKFYTKLIKLKDKNESFESAKLQTEITKLKDELENNHNIQERNWLLKKVNEFEALIVEQ